MHTRTHTPSCRGVCGHSPPGDQVTARHPHSHAMLSGGHCGAPAAHVTLTVAIAAPGHRCSSLCRGKGQRCPGMDATSVTVTRTAARRCGRKDERLRLRVWTECAIFVRD